MATKEDILEQIVEEYLTHRGYFVRHNIKFKPRDELPFVVLAVDALLSAAQLALALAALELFEFRFEGHVLVILRREDAEGSPAKHVTGPSPSSRLRMTARLIG